jgi:small subunit ribosomal protein S20
VANHPSALKRHRQSLRRRDANRIIKSTLRTIVRGVNEAVVAGEPDKAREELGRASRALAKAASKGTIHRRSASRRTSRLARKVAALSNS